MLVPWRVSPSPQSIHHDISTHVTDPLCCWEESDVPEIICDVVEQSTLSGLRYVFGGRRLMFSPGLVGRSYVRCVSLTQDASHHQDYYLYDIFIILLQYVFSMGSRDNPNHTHSGLKSWWNCDEMSHKMWKLWDLFFAPCRIVMPHKAFEWLAQSLCWKYT